MDTSLPWLRNSVSSLSPTKDVSHEISEDLRLIDEEGQDPADPTGHRIWTTRIRLAQLLREFHVFHNSRVMTFLLGDLGVFSSQDLLGKILPRFFFFVVILISASYFSSKIFAKHNPSMPVTFGLRSKRAQIIVFFPQEISPNYRFPDPPGMPFLYRYDWNHWRFLSHVVGLFTLCFMASI